MTTRNLGLARATALALVLIAVSGCGSGGLRLAPVSGTVTVDGAPLAGAGVSFRADESKGNSSLHIPSGTADGEGKYELTTATQKGAPPGWYKVVVMPPVPSKPGAEAPKVVPPSYKKKYASPEATDLRIEVKDGAPPGSYDLKLSR